MIHNTYSRSRCCRENDGNTSPPPRSPAQAIAAEEAKEFDRDTIYDLQDLIEAVDPFAEADSSDQSLRDVRGVREFALEMKLTDRWRESDGINKKASDADASSASDGGNDSSSNATKYQPDGDASDDMSFVAEDDSPFGMEALKYIEEMARTSPNYGSSAGASSGNSDKEHLQPEASPEDGGRYVRSRRRGFLRKADETFRYNESMLNSVGLTEMSRHDAINVQALQVCMLLLNGLLSSTKTLETGAGELIDRLSGDTRFETSGSASNAIRLQLRFLRRRCRIHHEKLHLTKQQIMRVVRNTSQMPELMNERNP